MPASCPITFALVFALLSLLAILATEGVDVMHAFVLALNLQESCDGMGRGIKGAVLRSIQLEMRPQKLKHAIRHQTSQHLARKTRPAIGNVLILVHKQLENIQRVFQMRDVRCKLEVEDRLLQGLLANLVLIAKMVR